MKMTFKEMFKEPNAGTLKQLCPKMLSNLEESKILMQKIKSNINDYTKKYYNSVNNFKKDLEKDLEKCFDDINDALVVIEDLERAVKYGK